MEMKRMPWFLSLGLIVTFMLGMATSKPVEAQTETDWDQVLRSISEKNSNLLSMEVEGRIDLEADNLGSSFLELDFRYSLEPHLAVDINFWLVGERVEYGPQGANGIVPIEDSGPVLIIDGLVYYFNGYVWTVSDATEILNLLEEEWLINTPAPDILNDQQMEAYLAFLQKYYDLSENETEYIIQLKENIHRPVFWQDAQDYQDLFLENGITQSTTATSSNQNNITPYEEWSESEKDAYFLIYQQLEMRYSKADYYLSSISFNLEANEEETQVLADYFYLTNIIEMADTNWFKLNLTLNFSNHGEAFEIKVPVNAPEYLEPEGTSLPTSNQDSWNIVPSLEKSLNASLTGFYF